LEASSSNGGSGANGYFVYDMISAADLATFNPDNMTIEVRGEDGSASGSRQDIWAQFDNVSVTPAENFVGQKWISASGANYNDGTRWNSGAAPITKGSVISFTDAISTDQNINITTGFSVAVINFDNTHRYTLGGAGQITIDTQVHGGGNVSNGFGEINVITGNHTIAANMGLTRDTVFNVIPANSTLTVSGTVGAQTLSINGVPHSGSTLTKDGAGVLEMKSLLIPNIFVKSGKIKMLANGGASNVSKTKSLTIAGSTNAWTSKLDLANDDMIIDYTAGSSPLVTIQNLIKNGFASGNWNGNGITSANAAASTSPKTAIGFLDTASLNPGTFDNVAVDSSSVLLKYTLNGDANLDGKVNALDFNAFASNYANTSGTWLSADFNYDGTVNSQDFSPIATNFGQGAVPGPIVMGALVPEPAGLAILIGGLALVRRSRTSNSLAR
jgi:hypothetical protein